MSFAAIKERARDLFAEAGFISHISNEDDYANALALMDELIDDYDTNKGLIEILSATIERWEDTAEAFSEFNERIANLDEIDTLKLIMEQHDLGVADLPEIGSKSLVSKIINRQGRNLTKDHIKALSARFGISPALFLG